MKYNTLSLVISFLLALLLFAGCKKDEAPLLPETPLSELEQRIAEVNELALPLPSSPLSISDESLSLLDGLADAKYVGLGEATHGTREFFQMKHRIFRYLVEHHGFRVFAFESDLGASLYLDDYIKGGAGELDQIMKEKLVFWSLYNEEVKDLLEWMKAYNLGKEASDKLHFIGFDCQYIVQAKPQMIERAMAIDTSLGEYLEKHLNFIPENFTEYANQSDRYKRWVKRNLDSIEIKILEQEVLLVNESNRVAYEMIKQLSKVMQQAEDVRSGSNIYFIGFNTRDKCMAQNISWISEYYGPDAKVAIWAHNGHVGKTPFIQELKVMGQHLDESFGANYKSLGFSLSSGSFTAININKRALGPQELEGVLPAESSNYIFQQAASPVFLVDLNSDRQGFDRGHWLNKKLPFLSIGSTYSGEQDESYVDLNLSQTFDYLIHFDVSNYSKQLE